MIVVGVLVNPIAGFGGALAMHGTDHLPTERFDEAVRAGRSAHRLIRALRRFLGEGVQADLLAAPGLLGASALDAAGIRHRALPAEVQTLTTRADTIAAARRLAADGIDVLVFAGGDGTATDIAEAVGTGIPVIGVPSGVKMHSEVFSRSPESAGRLLADVVGGHAASDLAEVLDVGADDVSSVVGMLLAPRARDVLQGAKTSAAPGSSAAAARALAAELVAAADPGTTWVIGPGATAGAVADALGFGATLRGVDVRHPDGRVQNDVDEQTLHDVVMGADASRLVLGVVGGQGFLLGRGNQQISSRVIEAVGVDGVEIVATPAKVGGLFPPVLLVDADADEPSPLIGYRTVRLGVRHSTVMNVIDARGEAA